MKCKRCGREVKKLHEGLCNTCNVINKNNAKVKEESKGKRAGYITKEELEKQKENEALIQHMGRMYRKDADRDKEIERNGGNAHLNKVVDGKLIKGNR